MRRVFKYITYCLLTFLVSTVLTVAAYRWLPVPITPLMVIRCVQNIHNGETAAIHHKWVPLKQISPYLPVAVMASEDQNFMHHHGFDFNAIQDAAIERLEGKRSRGGSTISQQTAKNVFLWPQSSWLRKGFEVYFTVLIELMWPKERIMEVYLNSIEMGPNIYGAEAVAQRHFGCSARKLRRSDCALIAATLPNPLRFSSLAPSGYMRKRQKKIEQEMRHIPLITKDAANK
uniref:monofunctional biosynthetic peptidoglycan transglycosylase n=1 Tax=Alloprevotella sp. TaxID=1872471 RepID=UPI003FF0E740